MCEHEVVCVIHNVGTPDEERVHRFVALQCWCRPITTCTECRVANVPMTELRAHVYPLWAVAAEPIGEDPVAAAGASIH